MSKESFEKILGTDYYNEFNNHCLKRTGKNIQDIGWRDGTNWVSEMDSYLKDNFNASISKPTNGPLGRWCHGASILKCVFELNNMSEESTIKKVTKQGVFLAKNPKSIFTVIVVPGNNSEFLDWLYAFKYSMDYFAETKGIQKTLFS